MKVDLTDAARELLVDDMVSKVLGRSGPNVGVALQSTYQAVQVILSATNPDTMAAAIAAKLGSGADVATVKTALDEWLAELAAAHQAAAAADTAS